MDVYNKQTNKPTNNKTTKKQSTTKHTNNFPKKKIKKKSNPWNIEKDMKARRMEHIEESVSLIELSKPGLG